ncbi:MAG: DUF4330 domain-containing protein [Bacillota bacterium]
MIDKRGRLFGFINVLDLAILLVLAALVAGVTYRLVYMGAGAQPGAEERPARLTVLVEDVRQPTVDAIKVGDVVRDHDNSMVFGTIVKKEVRPAQRVVTTADGRLVLANPPDRFDITLEIDARALVTQDAIVIARKETRIGSQVRIKAQLFSVMTTVMGIVLR